MGHFVVVYTYPPPVLSIYTSVTFTMSSVQKILA